MLKLGLAQLPTLCEAKSTVGPANFFSSVCACEWDVGWEGLKLSMLDQVYQYVYFLRHKKACTDHTATEYTRLRQYN